MRCSKIDKPGRNTARTKCLKRDAIAVFVALFTTATTLEIADEKKADAIEQLPQVVPPAPCLIVVVVAIFVVVGAVFVHVVDAVIVTHSGFPLANLKVVVGLLVFASE